MTVPIAIRRQPARAHGIPPLRTRSSSPICTERRVDRLAIRVWCACPGVMRRRELAELSRPGQAELPSFRCRRTSYIIIAAALARLRESTWPPDSIRTEALASPRIP
jgi:hypothetical protein